MGILSMIGAVSAEEHNRIVAKKDKLIADADYHMKGEDFDGVDDHPGRVALIMARLRASRSRFDKSVKDLAAQADQIENLKARIKEAEADCEEWKGAALRNQEDAEAMRARRANDRNRVRTPRAKAPAASDTVKTGAATGKPRTAIRAKVGGATAKLSGKGSAKKAVR